MRKALFLTAALGCLWMSVPLRAQSLSTARLTTEVPFAFVSGGHTLPAGSYTIETGQTWIRFSDAAARPVQTLLPSSRENADLTPRLVFRQYGDQYFLWQIWTRSKLIGFRTSRVEHALQASRTAPPGIVTTALR